MKTRLVVLTLLAVSTAPGAAWSQRVVFDDVKTRFSRSATDRRLVDKDADLVLDDEARRLTVKNDGHPLDVSYDDIEKVVFDVSTHMRGGVLGRVVLGGLAGAAVSGKTVSDYWCYLEFRGADGVVRPYMLEIGKDSSADAMKKMQALFGDKVVVAQFAEKAEEVEKDSLKDLQSKHEVDLDDRNHPLPETRTDKALVVIVCPPLAARDTGKGNQFKLHANDRVVAVNKMGSYTFVHLDPGEYLLVSQAGNASGMRMTLEAGKEYFFLQDTFMGTWKADTSLSRHSKELVMYELSGARFADWHRK